MIYFTSQCLCNLAYGEKMAQEIWDVCKLWSDCKLNYTSNQGISTETWDIVPFLIRTEDEECAHPVLSFSHLILKRSFQGFAI